MDVRGLRSAAFCLVLFVAGCSETSQDTPPPSMDAGMDVEDDAGVPPEGIWTSAASITAGPRQEVSVVALNGEVYVLGGFNEALQVVPTVEVYNPATDTWRSAQQMPARMHHANAAVVDGKIVVAGFLTGFGFLPDGRVYTYDPDADAWTAGTRMPDGSERGASGAGAIGSKVYVAGGLRGGAIRDFSSYDTESDTWETLPDLPIQLDHLVTGVVDGVFYTVGGRNQRIGSHTPRVFAFDPEIGEWSERAPMPTSRAGHAAAVLDGRIYVLGGEGNGDHPSGVFDDNEVYTPATDTWEVLAPIPTRRHGTGAATVDGQIILPGGADVQAFGAIPVVEIFTPAP